MATERVPYKTAAWQAARSQVLARDKGRCQIKGPKCSGAGTDVDHIKPWRDGGSWYALSNLRLACKSCNSSRSAYQKHHSGWKRSNTHIVLVVGRDKQAVLPDLGVRAQDVVLDADSLAYGLGVQPGHAAAGVVWEFLLKEMRRGELPARCVWIFSEEPGAVDKYPHHRLIDLNKEGERGVESRGGQTSVEPGRF